MKSLALIITVERSFRFFYAWRFVHLLPFEFYSLVEQRCFVAATFLHSSSSCRLEHAPIWHVGVSLCRCISVHVVLRRRARVTVNRRGAGSGNAFDGRRTAYSPTRSSLRPATSRTSSHSHCPARGAKGGLRQRWRQRLRQPWRRRRGLRQRRRGRRARRRSERWSPLFFVVFFVVVVAVAAVMSVSDDSMMSSSLTSSCLGPVLACY